MELAIPMVLLGGMYVLSNQNGDQQNGDQQNVISGHSTVREEFVPNRNAQQVQVRSLPNTNTAPINFPVNGVAELAHNPSYYPNSNAATDKYFYKDAHIKKAKQDTNNYTSLTGDQVKLGDMTHNNMVPFFGSSVKQNTRNLEGNESRMDSMNGSGSQQITKREIAPLFKPQENMQWAHGTPNASDFIQSRMNPSMSMNNVKPFQEIRVGPGLNQQGGVLGSGGFNSGMEARDKWMDKTVDQLRTTNNPKVTYSGVLLGAKRDVANRGVIGRVEKNSPDTYYINSPERYMTTTGIEKAQTARGIEILKPENRETTTGEYFGTAQDAQGEATYIPGQYRQTMRPQLAADVTHITNAHVKDAYKATDGDFGVNGYKDSVLPNNRMVTGGQQEYGIVGTFAKAIVAPIMDILRPSRKENVVGNLRPTGNAGSAAVTAGVVYDSANRARTTIREMTETRPDHMFVDNQQMAGGYGYTVSKQQSTDQQRDSTSCPYVGGGGNTQGTSNAPTYNAAYNANLINKEPLSRGRVPTTSNTKLFNGQSHTNIKVDKLECDRANNRMWVPQQITKSSPAKEQYGYGSTRAEYGQDIQTERNNPAILDAFNSNPYTKSLQSWA